MSPLAGWENFYVIVGSSAGALIGLQFVVVTLIADMPMGPNAAEAGEAFATPTIVHFGVVVLLAALLNAPWQTVSIAAVAWGLVGVGGFIYALVVWRRMRVQTAYRPETEDWVFYALLPLMAYATLSVSAVAARLHTSEALFAVGVAALTLLFIGIHNAWDSVTYHVYVQRRRRREAETARRPGDEGE